ncbi:multiple sugar transport system permease protein [Paenibacillus shirakamiensis]|uniref:Multiple sugar transport system permease protein n=1 Tax=Paenibacillus shirakamiensis TaxID=1265935 RepID=A0ABS4JED8_9BACL|nr:sugar ABC transporter permease [Paenibacillus shirakamiensis]MBP2000074.1 multiple sugar transport system permease protein [Paenibacillus shirakamiensis]
MNRNAKTAKSSLLSRVSQLAYRETGAALVFVLPFIIGFLIFNVIPMVYSVIISLMNYNSFKPLSMVKFVGLDNYVRVFHDPIALNAFVKSFLYTLFYVPGLIIFSFILAKLLNRTFALRGFTRTLILMPYVANVVAVSIVWSILLDPFGGPVNQIIQSLGFEPPLWLSGMKTVLPTIAGVNVWQSLAFQTIVFLAAIQGVNKDLYEAADIDGAGRWRRLWSITLPVISPTTFFLVITSIINSFQNYASVRMLTNGGPGTSSRVISLNIYEEAFTLNHYSYASAQAIILFVIVLVITIIQWKGQKRWVHY